MIAKRIFEQKKSINATVTKIIRMTHDSCWSSIVRICSDRMSPTPPAPTTAANLLTIENLADYRTPIINILENGVEDFYIFKNEV